MIERLCPRTCYRIESLKPSVLIWTGIGLYTFIPLLIGFLGKRGYIPGMSDAVCAGLMDGRVKACIMVGVVMLVRYAVIRSGIFDNLFDALNPNQLIENIRSSTNFGE